MFEVGSIARCNVRDVTFIVDTIQDLGEGVRLLGRTDPSGDIRWIREDICQLIKEG